ncbi:glutaredoxin [Oceanisphaera litoralis]|uniref:glutaredoxin family protein n=1 Tax=Oceanisphaera litoralis TaxID=225144 RepID=UPI001959809F|nr:glutaredoxin [Oceanisphaera litoralis]MBM7454515.1 glutaredoxin [Oceanisphaera litoralis]
MRIIILGADWCQYCNRAKALADSQDMPYTYHNLDMTVLASEASQLKYDAFIERKQGTLPQIYLEHPGGKPEYLGGYTELARHFNKDAVTV